MTTCRKCGGQKRRWPRSCSRCRSESDRAEAAAETGELAAELGVFGWIARGITTGLRILLRALD